MKVFVVGYGEIVLTQRHYVATGGQASVYVKDGTAYKIYTNRADAIPAAKFHALAAIKDVCVVAPEHALLDENKRLCGYTMKAIADNYSLCQLFTRAFRDRNGVTNNNIIGLAARLRVHVQNIHAADVLVVDLNELNILVDKSYSDTYLIDVDSYQTRGYPATVIMPSVRDYSVHAADFSAMSDWYSYGILAFQLFVGSHPFRGTHVPSSSVAKDQRLVHRMRHNISAFQPDVHLPGCCYGFDVIPAAFRDWLRAVLQDGKRLAPPDPFDSGAVVLATKAVKTLVSSGNIVIGELRDLAGRALLSYAESGAEMLIATASSGTRDLQIIHGARTMLVNKNLQGTTLVGFTSKLNQPVALNVHDGMASFYDFGRRTFEALPFRAQEIAKSGDRFYVKNGTRILEVDFAELADKIVVTASHEVADVPEHASHLHDGCCIANMLGSIFVSLLPRSRAGYQVRMQELDGYKISDAKFEGGVLMVVGAKNGQYDRLVFRFAPELDYQSYDTRVVEDIALSALNFVTLDSGVCVCVTEEEKLEAFSAKKDAKGIKEIDDPIIGSDMRLLKIAGKVGFERAGRLYQMTLK